MNWRHFGSRWLKSANPSTIPLAQTYTHSDHIRSICAQGFDMGLCETLVELAPLSFLVKSRLSAVGYIPPWLNFMQGAPLRSRRNLCRNLGGISHVYGSICTGLSMEMRWDLGMLYSSSHQRLSLKTETEVFAVSAGIPASVEPVCILRI